MKIAVIGGGSTYTPELVSGFVARAECLSLTELCLMDIDQHRLDVVGAFARRLVTASGSPFDVRLTTDRQSALEGASFVETQIRVGGMKARREDEYLGRRWDLVGQETTGVGGFANALRTIPVILGIACDMQQLCPDAWLVNFANPSGLVTEALKRYVPGVRSVGLCNSPIGWKMRIATCLGVQPADIELKYLGLNHLSWLTGAKAGGKDVWPEVLALYLKELQTQDDPAFPLYLIELMQVLPCGYLRYYYRTEAVLAKQRAGGPSRSEQVMDIEQDLLASYADPHLTALPDGLMQRGGAHYSTAAVQLIDALCNDTGETHIVNTRHGGAVPGWPSVWVCELPCRVDGEGLHPLPAEPLPTLANGLVHAVKAYELLAAEAAVTGRRGAALQALVAHPLGPGADRAPALFDDLLGVNRQYLTQSRD